MTINYNDNNLLNEENLMVAITEKISRFLLCGNIAYAYEQLRIQTKDR